MNKYQYEYCKRFASPPTHWLDCWVEGLPDGWDAGWLGCGLVGCKARTCLSGDRFSTQNHQKDQPEGKRRRWQAFRNQERHPDALQDPFTQKGSPIFRHFGVPPGTPKSMESRFVAKKSGSTEDFESIFVASVDFLIFSLLFSSIFL